MSELSELMTAPPRDDAAVRKEAVAWYARLCSGSAGDAERKAWLRWHAAHPDHQRAWQRIEAMRATLQQAPAGIASPVLRARLASGGQARRQVLRSVLLLAGTGTVGYLSWQTAQQHGLVQPWLADYSTAIGHQKRVQLPDGSLLIMNTGSAVDVQFDIHTRRVRLLAGEILAETARHRQAPAAPADTRPFIIETRHGAARALGTRFTVRVDDDGSRVTVLEHAVEITPRAPSATVRTLMAGQQSRFDASHAGLPAPAQPQADAWACGMLAAQDMRLDAFAFELSRYRPGLLRVEPQVAGLRLSGAFQLDDTDAVLESLARMLPVDVLYRTPYWVTLAARKK